MPTPDTMFCPSCGKANQTEVKICHYCGASTKERISLWIIPFGIALLLFIAFGHFFYAMTYQPVFVPISELKPERNFEHVRVKGRVTDVNIIRKNYSNHQVRIEIEDENETSRYGSEHRISVRLEGEPANDFLTKHEYVSRGDLIDVAASLYAGEGYRQLSISSAQFIKVLEKGNLSDSIENKPKSTRYEKEPPAPKTTVKDLLADPEKFRNQVIIARPLEVKEVSADLPFFKVCDEGQSEPQMVVFGYEGRKPSVGDIVSVRGQFVFYEKKGYWEIKIRNWDKGAVIDLSDRTDE